MVKFGLGLEAALFYSVCCVRLSYRSGVDSGHLKPDQQSWDVDVRAWLGSDLFQFSARSCSIVVKSRSISEAAGGVPQSKAFPSIIADSLKAKKYDKFKI